MPRGFAGNAKMQKCRNAGMQECRNAEMVKLKAEC
jgi:hypothetical protein